MLNARSLVGSNVAVSPDSVTVPATAPPAVAANVKLETTLAAFIASEKVAVMTPLAATPVAVSTGLVEDTVGLVVSDIVPVTNDQA